MDKYAVVVCSDCEFVRVVEQEHKTVSCGRCGKQHKMKKLKQFVTTDSMEKARLVASEIRAENAGVKEEFKELYEEGDLSMTDYESVYDTSLPNDQSKNETIRNQLSDKEVVLDIIRTQENPTREDILTESSEYLDKQKADDLLDRLLHRGSVIRSSEGIFRAIE